MHLMFEKGIRGGVSQVIHRYATANNKYMNNHDTNAPSNYLAYVDANNLYGWGMCKMLPIDNFQWDYGNEKDYDFLKWVRCTTN